MALADFLPTGRRQRFAVIDVLRGVAILAMVVYHGSWDLHAFGLIDARVSMSLGWVIFARSIAGNFLALSGFNLVLATRNGFRPKPFLRRLAVLVVAAGLVSLATWWEDPETFVFFGILHAIAAMGVLALPFRRAPLSVVTIVAILCLLAPHYLRFAVFDAPAWWWLGLSLHTPESVDYVPVMPWFGVVLGGVLVGRIVLARGGEIWLSAWAGRDPVSRVLAVIGRWSLLIYLLHQPILFGAASVVAPHIGPSEQAISNQFMEQCPVTCRAAGRDTPTCELYCGCVLSGLKDANLVTRLTRLTDSERSTWLGIVNECRPKAAPPAGDQSSGQ